MFWVGKEDLIADLVQGNGVSVVPTPVTLFLNFKNSSSNFDPSFPKKFPRTDIQLHCAPKGTCVLMGHLENTVR